MGDFIMKENKYNEKTFFEKYSQMSRSKQGLAGAGEWKTLEPLLPDFRGKAVLDLGCGYGWHCIYAAEHGAKQVIGIDISDRMLAVAREKTHFEQVNIAALQSKTLSLRKTALMLCFPPLRCTISSPLIWLQNRFPAS